MPIKYAARGISYAFVDAETLATGQGVVLKPLNGCDVFVWNNGLREIDVATAYNSETGGCTVGATTYASAADLQAHGYYVLSDTAHAYDCWNDVPEETYVCIATRPTTRYLYHSQVRDLDELHFLGVLRGLFPEMESVWGVSGSAMSGDTGIRYHNEDGYFVKCTSRPDNSEYYATLEECNAHWTTEEPVQEIIAWTNTSQSLTTTARLTTNSAYSSVARCATLFNELGKTFIFSSSKTYQITKWHDGTDWKDNDLLITAENRYVYPNDQANAILNAYNTTIYASAFKYIES